MSKVSYYTAEGLKKLREELNQLKDIERPKASQAIAEARDKGDLSENAEYDAAKEAQGMLEMKISKMEETLANARVIDESQLDTSKVLALSMIVIFVSFAVFYAIEATQIKVLVGLVGLIGFLFVFFKVPATKT